jgi:hypothetical protein
MNYYPKSQIKPLLYTSGGEFSTTPTSPNTPQIPYVGNYFEISNGNAYTGKNQLDTPNKLLYKFLPHQYENENLGGDYKPYVEIFIPSITIEDTTPSEDYIKIKNIKTLQTRYIPLHNPTYPTEQQIQQGGYTRYFCKKNNELVYIEIDNTTYQLLQNKSTTIAWDLYTPTTLSWKIGNQSSTQNQSTILAIEQNLKWYGFSQYFKNNFSSFPTSLRR